MKFAISFPPRCRVVAATLFLLCASGASAQPVLAEAGKAGITTSDVQGEAIRLPIPVENRKEALGNPDSVRQIADNLLVRRALAQKAEEAGLAQNEAVQAAIRIARDRVLSDAMIERIDAVSKPKPEVIDALAQTNYKANPKRFDLPEETGARHILIVTSTPDAKAKAEKVLADLKAGASFEKLARELSQDPGSAVKGGDLGYFGKGRMVAPFETALDKLQKPGELSDVVETQFGYHIIKLEGRRSAGVRPFEQVRDVLRAEAEAKLRNDARMAEVQRIREGVKFNQSAIEAFAASQK